MSYYDYDDVSDYLKYNPLDHKSDVEEETKKIRESLNRQLALLDDVKFDPDKCLSCKCGCEVLEHLYDASMKCEEVEKSLTKLRDETLKSSYGHHVMF